MKNFLEAFSKMIIELLVAICSLPVLILAIIVFELLDPIVKFGDTMRTCHKNKQEK